jgi:DNA-binding transcriptional LysR family regulator
MDDIEPNASASDRPARSADITLHQLRIFWAIAHSDTLTKAAKQLGLAQPSLSQQLSKLEAIVGAKLFHRRSNELSLTEAGSYLLPKAEHVLASMREIDDGLIHFSDGKRMTVRLAGISSLLRVILPDAVARLHQQFPQTDFDIQDSAPADILELLYARRVNIGLLAANSVAQAGIGFVQVPLFDDPYVLAVPAALDLGHVQNGERDLPPEQFALLNSVIQFNFGTPHAKRVEEWYRQMLPQPRVVAHCRSFEVAVGLVRSGLGICLAPALSTVVGAAALEGIRLYRVNAVARSIVALVPSQYRRVQPYASLLDNLQAVSAAFEPPSILPTPPFLYGQNLTEL